MDEGLLMRFILLLLLLSFLNSAAMAEPSPLKSAIPSPLPVLTDYPEESTLPDPGHLSQNWWSYFEVNEPALSKHSHDFEVSLDKSIDSLSSHKEEAEQLFQKIKGFVKNYVQASTQTPIPPSNPPPIASSYTITQALQLSHLLEKRTLELKSTKDDRKDLQQQIDLMQTLMEKEKQSYTDTPPRSEERFLLGLNLIANRLILAIKERHLSHLNKSIEMSAHHLYLLKEELEAASHKLMSTPNEQTQFETQIKKAENELNAANQHLKNQEMEVVQAESNADVEGGEVKNQALNQQLIFAGIKQTIALNTVISAKITYNLAKLINQPETIIPANLTHERNAWEAELTQLRDKTNSWIAQSQKIIERYAQILTVSGKDKESPALESQIIRLAQKNLATLRQLNSSLDDTFFLLDILNKKSILYFGEDENWLFHIWQFAKQSASHSLNWLQTPLFYIGKLPITLLSILRFLLILLATVWLSRLIIGGITKLATRKKGFHRSLIYRVNRLVHYLILCIGTIVALSAIGFDLSNFLLIAGALGVGLGFGLQSIFNNFISGIIILFESHLKVGDFIELESGIRGEVREINVRSTILTTNDGIDVLIPNSEIISNKVINWTLKNPYRRVHIPFAVPYGTDKELVAQIVVDAAKKVPKTLVRPDVSEPVVYLTKFGHYGLEFELAVWVNEKFTKHTHSTVSDYLWMIDSALNAQGIKVPLAQAEVVIHSVPPA
jgi:potassium-dependent mechanosensitive channel